MPEEIRLTIRNLELAALHWSAKSSTRILALHGWLDNAQSFWPLAEKLPDIDFVALDFPGHGHSGHRPAGEILHFVDYVADVYDVLNSLEWDKCLLMGHSMGAGVASLFASSFPEKLDGLICLDGLGPVTCQAKELPATLKRAVQLNARGNGKSETVYESLDHAAQARIRATGLNQSSARKLVERNLQKRRNGYVWRSDPRLRQPSLYYLSEQQVGAYLREIKVPTLLVRPDGPASRAQDVLKLRSALVGDLTCVEIPGGHHAHMNSLDHLLPALYDFICKVNMGLNTA